MRGDAPEDIDDVEVKIDWVVNDAVSNGVNEEEIQEILEDYKQRLEQDKVTP